MPTRRSERRRRRNIALKPKKVPGKIIFISLFVFFIVIALFALIWVVLPSKWDQSKRLTVVIVNEEKQASILIFSPQTSGITQVFIPSNTQIQVARQLGSYQIGNVYKLGSQEKLGGKLVAESITKSLKLPSDQWSEKPLLNLTDLTVSSAIKAVFSPYASSLTIKDKIKLALFSLRVKPSRFNQIDLQNIGYIMPSILKDGSDGFVARLEPPLSLSTYFADPDLLNAKIAILDFTDSVSISDELGQVIEMLGGKVFAVYDEPTTQEDCTIVTTSAHKADLISSLLDCQVNEQPSENGFDIQINIGKEFEKRF